MRRNMGQPQKRTPQLRPMSPEQAWNIAHIAYTTALSMTNMQSERVQEAIRNPSHPLREELRKAFEQAFQNVNLIGSSSGRCGYAHPEFKVARAFDCFGSGMTSFYIELGDIVERFIPNLRIQHSQILATVTKTDLWEATGRKTMALAHVRDWLRDFDPMRDPRAYFFVLGKNAKPCCINCGADGIDVERIEGGQPVIKGQTFVYTS